MIDTYKRGDRRSEQSAYDSNSTPKPRILLKAVWVPVQHWRWLRDTAAAHRNTMQAELAMLLTQAAEAAASRSPSSVDSEEDESAAEFSTDRTAANMSTE